MVCKICGETKEEHSINGFCLNKKNWDLTDKYMFLMSNYEKEHKLLDKFEEDLK